MTRRIVAVAGLAVAGALFSAAPPASACDPYKPPLGCNTPCTITRDAYNVVFNASGGYGGPLPSWYELDLMNCG